MDKEEIKFSNEWFSGQHRIEEAGHYPFAIYGLLIYIENNHLATEITIDSILRVFNMQEKNQRNTIKIKDAIKYLQEQDIITFYDSIFMRQVIDADLEQIKGKTPLYIKVKERPQERYSLITFIEFEKLLLDEVHKGNAKVELICYFSTIMFHINAKTKRAFPSLTSLKGEACIGREDTCSKYNKFLMDELKMIRFQNSGKTNPETGRPYPTQYVRYEDEEALEEEMIRQRGYSRGSKLARMMQENENARKSVSIRITNLQKRLDEMDSGTTEYIDISRRMTELEAERSALLIEYKELKIKEVV